MAENCNITELWYSRKANLKNLQVFRCIAYAHVPKENIKKLDAKAQKLTFIGYSEESKAYRLLDKVTKQITISRDVIFQNDMQTDKIPIKRNLNETVIVNSAPDTIQAEEENPEMLEELEEDRSKNKNKNKKKTKKKSNQEKSTEGSVSAFSYHVDSSSAEYEDVEEESQENEPRRSTRNNIGVLPDRYMAGLHLVTQVDEEPRNLKEAMCSANKDKSKTAVKEEMESLKKNKTWTLIEPPKDRKIVGCKWVFKIKQDANGAEIKYKARLVQLKDFHRNTEWIMTKYLHLW